MNVFLTGGTGFLGARLIEYLLMEDFIERLTVLYRSEEKKHILIHNFLRSYGNNQKKLEFVKGDFFDSTICESNCNVLVHAGAMRNIANCENNNELAYEINVEGTRKLVADAIKSDCSKAIFISSQSVYDFETGGEHSEEEKLNPATYYGETKVLGEDIIKNSEFEYLILRPSRLIGFGIFQNKDNFISYILPNKIKKGETVTLFGGINKRYNCIDVRDCARAIVLLLESDNAWNSTYNISNDNMISILEVNDIYTSAAGKDTYKTIFKNISRDVTEFKVSNDKIKSAIDWKPEYTYEKSLKDILDVAKIEYDDGETENE